MIKLDKISKKYNENYVLKDVSITFNMNEIAVVIGPSGGGKTTLLKCISFLEKPTSGNVYIDGKKITSKNRLVSCKKVGIVFQNFNLFSHMDVENNLIYSPTKVFGVKIDEAKEKANILLSKFGLQNKMHDNIASLSGGQKQRVAIARALMLDPQVILFDEPTSALDPENIKDIISIILSLKSQMTIIIITHHIKFAKSIADKIIFMDQGHVLDNAPKEEFFKNPTSNRARVFLENIGDLI